MKKYVTYWDDYGSIEEGYYDDVCISVTVEEAIQQQKERALRWRNQVYASDEEALEAYMNENCAYLEEF